MDAAMPEHKEEWRKGAGKSLAQEPSTWGMEVRRKRGVQLEMGSEIRWRNVCCVLPAGWEWG